MLSFLKSKKGIISWDTFSFVLGIIVGVVATALIFIGTSFAGLDLGGLISGLFGF